MDAKMRVSLGPYVATGRYSPYHENLSEGVNMKKITVCMVILALVAGVAYAKGIEVKKKAGEYTVSLTMNKTPSVGTNDIEIGIKDASGNDVTDAIVKIEYSMPAMSGMPAMNYRAATEVKGKLYKGTMNLSMAGAWTINIKIVRGEKVVSTRLTVDVS